MYTFRIVDQCEYFDFFFVQRGVDSRIVVDRYLVLKECVLGICDGKVGQGFLFLLVGGYYYFFEYKQLRD